VASPCLVAVLARVCVRSAETERLRARREERERRRARLHDAVKFSDGITGAGRSEYARQRAEEYAAKDHFAMQSKRREEEEIAAQFAAECAEMTDPGSEAIGEEGTATRAMAVMLPPPTQTPAPAHPWISLSMEESQSQAAEEGALPISLEPVVPQPTIAEVDGGGWPAAAAHTRHELHVLVGEIGDGARELKAASTPSVPSPSGGTGDARAGSPGGRSLADIEKEIERRLLDDGTMAL
jgi:hypothetical protein